MMVSAFEAPDQILRMSWRSHDLAGDSRAPQCFGRARGAIFPSARATESLPHVAQCPVRSRARDCAQSKQNHSLIMLVHFRKYRATVTPRDDKSATKVTDLLIIVTTIPPTARPAVNASGRHTPHQPRTARLL
jgi:hypothetical protein